MATESMLTRNTEKDKRYIIIMLIILIVVIHICYIGNNNNAEQTQGDDLGHRAVLGRHCVELQRGDLGCGRMVSTLMGSLQK